MLRGGGMYIRIARPFQAAGREVTLRLYPHCLHGFLVYAPYLTKGVSAQEKAETEEAWEEVFTFLQGLS